MENKSRAFILTEILTGMMLQAGFIIVLCGAFYMTINFYTRTTKILAAREKGQRVISFLDEKVRHAGLGLWRCTSSTNLRGLMSQVTDFQDLDYLPIAINKFDNIMISNWLLTFGNGARAEKYGDIIRGNILTLLYAEKVRDKIIAINTGEYVPSKLEASQNNEFKFVLNNSNKYYAESFNTLGTEDNIRSWAVTPTAGVPLLLKKSTSTTRDVNISTNTDISTMSIDIASGAELLTLKCERFFVESDNNYGTGRNFAYFTFEDTWERNSSNKKKNYEPGILEIYCELDTRNNILNFYVLASGGYDSSINHEKPDSWPDSANWEDDYKHHYIYISRKSWHLDNISWASTGWN